MAKSDEPVTIKIPAGTRSGRTFRVKGRGVRSNGAAGDLLDGGERLRLTVLARHRHPPDGALVDRRAGGDRRPRDDDVLHVDLFVQLPFEFAHVDVDEEHGQETEDERQK